MGYDGELEKEMQGPTFQLLSKMMKVLVKGKITVPGSFVGHSTTPAVSCSYKAASGFIYPLERGMIFIYKPPIFVKYEDVESINFARMTVERETCGRLRRQKACQSFQYCLCVSQCVGNNIVPPTMVSQCPKMSNNVWGGGIKQAHQTPAGA